MKLGYSLLLSEYLAADEVDYGDCRDFQIVCPACREAVFKAGSAETKRRWLSHYAAAPDSDACELRVAQFTKGQVEAQRIMARGQHLSLFQGLFRQEMLLRMHPTDVAQRDKVAWHVDWMIKRPTFREIVRHLRARYRSSPRRREEAWSRITDTYDHMSPFWLRRQRAFAEDFAEHLMSGQAFQNLAFALCIGLRMDWKLYDTAGAFVLKDGERQPLDPKTSGEMKRLLDLLIMGQERELRPVFGGKLPPEEDVYLAGSDAPCLASIGLRSFTLGMLEFPYTTVLAKSLARVPADAE